MNAVDVAVLVAVLAVLTYPLLNMLGALFMTTLRVVLRVGMVLAFAYIATQALIRMPNVPVENREVILKSELVQHVDAWVAALRADSSPPPPPPPPPVVVVEPSPPWWKPMAQSLFTYFVFGKEDEKQK